MKEHVLTLALPRSLMLLRMRAVKYVIDWVAVMVCD